VSPTRLRPATAKGTVARRQTMLEVQTRTVSGRPAAVGSAGPHTLVVDRPADGGGDGIGFNGGELLYLAVAGCISNDIYREAAARGISLQNVRVVVRGDFAGDPAVSQPIEYEVEIEGEAEPERLEALVELVDGIAEIPNSLRQGTPVRLAGVRSRTPAASP
jgi:putative redox protein